MRHKKLVILAVFLSCLCSHPSFAQGLFGAENSTPSHNIQSFHIANLKILPLGIAYTYEQKISSHISVSLQPYFVIGGHSSSFGIVLQAGLDIEGRYYYNREKRASQGKNLLLNSGNFLGIAARYAYMFYPTQINDPYFSYKSDAQLFHFPAIFWGMRRAMSERTFFELALGLQYRVLEDATSFPIPELLVDGVMGASSSRVYPYVSFKFGLRLK